MSSDDLTPAQLVARRKKLESQMNFLEKKLEAILIRSPSTHPFQITLKEYVERAFVKSREDPSSNPLPHRDRDELLRAFSHEDVSFARDFLKPYLIFRQRLEEVGEQIQRIQEAVTPTKSSVESEAFVFQLENEVYRIVYSGQKFPPAKASLGLRYITKLLAGRAFDTPIDLINAVEGMPVAPPSGKAYGEMSSEELHEKEGLHFEGNETGGRDSEIMDGQYRKEVKLKLESLAKEKEIAESNNDLATIEKLGNKEEDLRSFFEKWLDVHKHSRRWSTEGQKRKKAYRRPSSVQCRKLKRSKYPRGGILSFPTT